jgi:hypothetical protein
MRVRTEHVGLVWSVWFLWVQWPDLLLGGWWYFYVLRLYRVRWGKIPDAVVELSSRQLHTRMSMQRERCAFVYDYMSPNAFQPLNQQALRFRSRRTYAD